MTVNMCGWRGEGLLRCPTVQYVITPIFCGTSVNFGGKQVLVPAGWKIGRFPYLADGCKGMFSVPQVAKVFTGLVLYYWLLSTVIGC